MKRSEENEREGMAEGKEREWLKEKIGHDEQEKERGGARGE